MKFSLKWIQDFVDLSHLDTHDLFRRLPLVGFEVESVEFVGRLPDSVVAVQILSIEKHPQADRLTLCTVDLGATQNQVNQKVIVCGAKNMKVGHVVPLALPGTCLPDGRKIERSVIRTVQSEGMLCAKKELGIIIGKHSGVPNFTLPIPAASNGATSDSTSTTESEGLWILPVSTPLGKPIRETLNLEDCIFELSLPPNRSDCLSMRGLAKEISAIFDLPLKPQFKPDANHVSWLEGSFPATNCVSVEVLQAPFSSEKKSHSNFISSSDHASNSESCLRYLGRVLKDVSILPSPFGVQYRLQNLGIRSINHVVDASNWVMLAMGQPLHVFDLKKISSKKIRVTQARNVQSKKIKTLDGVERVLRDQDWVIADDHQPIAIAGVLGGLETAVQHDTNDLFLESACFDMVAIRKTARSLAIHSESSHRFERGVSRMLQEEAIDLLTSLIYDWGREDVARLTPMGYGFFTDTKSQSDSKLRVSETVSFGEKAPPKRQILFRLSYFQSLMGFLLSSEQTERFLIRVGLNPQPGQEVDTWLCEIPVERFDLEREVDIVEELARLAGYDQIPAHVSHQMFGPVVNSYYHPSEFYLRHFLEHHGFSEVIHYSFISAREIEWAGFQKESCLELANPISEDLQVLRPSLIPSLLACVQRNLSHQKNHFKIYELRSIYRWQSIIQDGTFPILEWPKLALAWVGDRFERRFGFLKGKVDFYDLKGVLEQLLAGLRIEKIDFLAPEAPYLHPGLSATVQSGVRKIGELGVLHPKVAESFGIAETVVLGEFDLQQINDCEKRQFCFTALPKFPFVDRDLTLIVPISLDSATIVKTIESLHVPYLKSVQLVDLYQGASIPEDSKSLTYALIYQDVEKTLTDLEVNEIHCQTVEKLKMILPIEWRLS